MAADETKGRSRKDAMTRGDVVSRVAAKLQMPQSDADKVVREFEAEIVEALKSGTEVRLTGFGTFRVAQRAARSAPNPRDRSVMVDVPARTVPRFAPGKGLKDSVGGTGEAGGQSRGGAKKGAAKGAAAKSGAGATAASGAKSAAKTTAAKSTAAKGDAKGATAKSDAKGGAAKGGAAKGGAAKGAKKGK